MGGHTVDIDPNVVDTAAHLLAAAVLSLHQAGVALEFDMWGSSEVHTLVIDTASPVAPEGAVPEQREHAGSRADPGRMVEPEGSRNQR